MTEFEKILKEEAPMQEQKKPHPDSEGKSYGEQMKEKRDRCYAMVSDACMEIPSDEEHFKRFLSVLSRFERYSLNNNILIYAQKPNAMRLKDHYKVLAEKQRVRVGAKPVYILEPEKVSGESGEWTRYNAVAKYDVADLENELLSVETALDPQMKIRALLHKCPVEIKTVPANEYPAERKCGAYYDVEHNRIVAKADMGYDEIFLSVATAMAHVEMKRSVEGAYDPNQYTFEAKCAAFSLAKRYDIPTDSLDFSKVAERYRDRNEEETKASLAMIHKSVKGIHYRMSLKLEPPKEQSREER